MAHYLLDLAHTVNRTHPHLGELVAAEAVAVKAKKCFLAIAPAGTGKSVAGRVVAATYHPARFLDSVTRAGLASLKHELTGFSGVCVIDDLGKIDTYYSRVSTLTTFCELVYSHFVEKHSQGTHVEVSDFYGSCVLNCQPAVLRRVVRSPEWEATIQDKTLRFYHLFRPTQPRPTNPDISVNWGLSLESVKGDMPSGKAMSGLLRLAGIQWSRARAKEHMPDLLRAAAALDGRNHVTGSDAQVLLRLMRPMALERVLMRKESFEEGRDLDANLLCVITEFATYGSFTLEDLCADYKVNESVASGLMRNQSRWWESTKGNSVRFFPSGDMARVLNVLGLKVVRKE